MFWPVLIVLYIGILIWVLIYLVKVHKTSLAGSDLNREEALFVFSRGDGFPDPKEQEIIRSPKTFVFTENTENPDVPFSPDAQKPAPPIKTPVLQNVNIAHVTRDLIGFVMKMPGEERIWLAKEIAGRRQPVSNHVGSGTAAKHLIEMIMHMPMEDRCALLSAVKSRMGVSRRKFARKNYMAPVYFVVRGMLTNAYTKNVSNGGVLIETFKVMTRNFNPGESITMSLPHPRIQKEVKIHGKIIRVMAGAIAVSFDKPV